MTSSRAAWRDLKARQGSHYIYTVNDARLAGATETTIEVVADRVTRRTQRHKGIEGPWTDAWTEENATVGAHPGDPPPNNLEQVYDRCESEVLSKDPATHIITLTIRPNGVLETCAWDLKNCADGCGAGVYISKLEFVR